MSLIELMVGLVIGLVLSLIMFKALLYAEGQRRTTSAGNDAQQAGTLGSYGLQRSLRLGGSGFSGITAARGCMLNIFSGSTTMVPLPSTLAAPFDGLQGLSLPVSPVLIANAGVDNDGTATNPVSDALIVMAGTHASVNTWFQMTAAGATTKGMVINSMGLATGDLLMAVDSGSGTKAGTCTVVQATSSIDSTSTHANYRQSTSSAGQQIDIGSTYTSSNGLSGYTTDSQLADLGASPIFQIFAVANSSTGVPRLQSYDMFSGTTQDLNDDVVNLQAAYGLSATTDSGDTTVTSWQAPVGSYSLHSLRQGDAAAVAIINRIRAIRLSILTRSAIREKVAVQASPTIDMLADLGANKVTITNTGTDLNYRYRLFDVTIPLRNH